MNKIVIIFFIAITISACGGSDNNDDKATAEKREIVNTLTQEVAKNPDSAVLRMKLINSLDSLKMYDKAIAHTDSLIRKDSLNQGLWFTKGQLLENSKDTPNAIICYKRAIRIYPSVDAQLYLANLLAETKNADALKLCGNVLQMGLGRESDANANFIAGVYFARTGQQKKAIEAFDKAISDNYTLMEAYMEKGFIYFDNKNFNSALKTFQTAISINNRYADAYYWKAKTLEVIGKKDEAAENYEQALVYDKNLEAAKEGLRRVRG